jgi:hypothetical protein
MANDEVFMDIPRVQDMAKNFNTFGDVLDGVDKALHALSITLHVSAWFSFGATEAAAQYVDRIEPNVKKMSAKMKELNGDILSAIASYRDGDNSGSKRFI